MYFIQMDQLKGIALRSYNGDKREGSRHAYILKELRKRGCKPVVDSHKNIWVEKGKGKPVVLFSSHIDLDPKIKKPVFKELNKKGQKSVFGVLDNCVGCYINLVLASKKPKKGTSIYLFTASEEVQWNCPRIFSRSAKEVVAELKRRNIKPDICIAIDVTYPAIVGKHDDSDLNRHYYKTFDLSDKTHCYIDCYASQASRKVGKSLVKKFNDPKVKFRNLHGHDEAFIYGRIAPAFGFGPVVYGPFDKPNQLMPLSHMKSAIRFLRSF
jgi:acetylornithine deacetylase/succinyl-diaminopimelate desuccinylase-like protein